MVVVVRSGLESILALNRIGVDTHLFKTKTKNKIRSSFIGNPSSGHRGGHLNSCLISRRRSEKGVRTWSSMHHCVLRRVLPKKLQNRSISTPQHSGKNLIHKVQLPLLPWDHHAIKQYFTTPVEMQVLRCHCYLFRFFFFLPSLLADLIFGGKI